MELTQLQMSEILSNYTSSSEGFVTLQSLIMNSLMKHKRGLFVANTDMNNVGLQSISPTLYVYCMYPTLLFAFVHSSY